MNDPNLPQDGRNGCLGYDHSSEPNMPVSGLPWPLELEDLVKAAYEQGYDDGWEDAREGSSED